MSHFWNLFAKRSSFSNTFYGKICLKSHLFTLKHFFCTSLCMQDLRDPLNEICIRIPALQTIEKKKIEKKKSLQLTRLGQLAMWNCLVVEKCEHIFQTRGWEDKPFFLGIELFMFSVGTKIILWKKTHDVCKDSSTTH